ncbi:hypothetical protein Bca4012_064031 [Brassica carinata]
MKRNVFMSGFVMGFERGFGLRPAQPEKLSNTPFSPPVVILLCIDPSCTWIEQWVHRAGPREKIYFGPEDVKAAIDTCGGICPGLNDVIRHIFITLEIYGVKNVVGITLENDILHMDKTFGFETAIEETQLAINSAYIEAHSAYHGIGAAKLMGRSSGFIAMIVPDASLASGPVDLCSAVICVAEGAGQTFLENTNAKDASGNKLLGDIRCSHSTRDPTYMIQAVPANESDGILCTVLGQNAVHGAFSGYSGITVGIINNHYAYLPIPEVVAYDKSVDPNSRISRGLQALQPNRGRPLSHLPPLLNQMHISPLELLDSGPLLDFNLLPRSCSSMTASSLPYLPNLVISDMCKSLNHSNSFSRCGI